MSCTYIESEYANLAENNTCSVVAELSYSAGCEVIFSFGGDVVLRQCRRPNRTEFAKLGASGKPLKETLKSLWAIH